MSAIEAAFGPTLEEVGLDFERGYVETRDGGAHLALYATPSRDEAKPEDYVDRLVPTLAALGPIVFAYTGLASFDLCQEMPDASGPAETVLIVPRSAYDAVPDWNQIALPQMIRLLRQKGGELEVGASVARSESWIEAEIEARRG